MAELQRLAERYRTVIVDHLGLSVRPVDDATLAFEAGGLNLLLFLEERDPEYLHLVAMFPPPDPQIDAAELAKMCIQVTKEAKVAKVVLDEDGDLIVSAEIIMAGTDLMPTERHIAAVLPRAISAVFNAVTKTSMSLELIGISKAVYNGGSDRDEDEPGSEKQSPAKQEQNRWLAGYEEDDE